MYSVEDTGRAYFSFLIEFGELLNRLFRIEGDLGTQPLLLALVQEMLSYRGAQDAGQNESEHHVDKWVSQPGGSISTHFGFTLMS